MATSIQYRANLELIDWIASADTNWYHTVFRIQPRRHQSPERINTNLFKSIRWTLSEVRRQLNQGTPIRFVPFWGGEPKNGVGIHIHALAEVPLGEDEPSRFQTFLETELCRLSQKAFGYSVNPTVWATSVEVSEGRPLAYLSRYVMRSEGETFRKGTEKLILELLRLS
jgi:hypothetical protein